MQFYDGADISTINNISINNNINNINNNRTSYAGDLISTETTINGIRDDLSNHATNVNNNNNNNNNDSNNNIINGISPRILV